ncbi:MAG: hypothetical protein Q7T05_00780 [Dehalococcoidia bacterium]|nr:hypothetical protein [Dehalococcoidia bacterium]
MATARYVFGKSRTAEAPAEKAPSSGLNAGVILVALWIAIISVVVLGGLIALFLG